MSCCNHYSNSKLLPQVTAIGITPSPITKCCLNCQMQIGEVETLSPEMPAYAHLEQGQCSGYTLDLGIPQGVAGNCDSLFKPDGQGCFLMVATDGSVVRCCLVRSGSSSNYKWDCKSIDAELPEEGVK